MTPDRWKTLLRSLAAVLGLATLAVSIFYLPGIDPGGLRAAIDGFGPAAPLAFIIICVIKPVIFFLPSLGLTVIAGTLFGPFYGTIYVMLGGAGSTAVGFYVARRFGRRAIEDFIKRKKRLEALDGRMEEDGFRTILLLRVMNIHWDLVSYTAGLSRMRFRDFYAGSLILLPPMSFIYTWFGSAAGDPLSPSFLISAAVMTALGSIPFFLYGRRHARGQ